MLQLLIPKRASRCTRCDTPFVPGQSLLTLLHEMPNETYQRQDLCETCANGAQETLGHWRSTYPDKKKKRSLTGTERFLSQFKEALAQQEGERSYLLALYLQRRDLFRRVKTLKRKGGDVVIFEQPATGEAFEVPAVQVKLSFDDL